MITCKECGHECTAKNALGYHLRSHGITYPEYVVRHEHGGEWPHCTCGKRLEHRKGGFPRYCSNSCASSGENNPMHGRKGELSPIKGIKRTPVQLKNYSEGAKKRWQLHGDVLRELMKTEEYREKQSVANRYSYANSDRAKKVSKSLNLFWTTSPLATDLRREASERSARLVAENKIGPQAPFKREWKRSPWTGEDEYMHSSWESIFFDACVERGYEVTKNHGITIPYAHPDGTTRIYVPDFYATEDRVLYEVKGRHDEVDVAKWHAAGAWCDERGMSFCVLFDPKECSQLFPAPSAVDPHPEHQE
jgi:hypothetical protein